MSEISRKKKKFIKKNFKKLSIEELARQTGLKPQVIRSLIDGYSAETSGKDQSDQIKTGSLNFLSLKTILLIFLFFTTGAITIYSPSLNGQFVFDDEAIWKNSLIHIERLSQLPDLIFSKRIGTMKNRKICFVSFALNYYFGGLNPFGYHLVNVIIHTLNGLILFLLSYTILTLPLAEGTGGKNAFKIAFLGSFIWLTHPIQTQAVSYVYQRLASLTALFFLLSLLCYMKGRVNQTKKRVALFILSMLFGLLALFTKQNAATLPLFIILSEFLFFQGHSFKMDKKKLGFIMFFVVLFILIAGIYLGPDFISRKALVYEKKGWTPLERMLTELRVVIFYLSLLIYPHPSRLNLDHDFPISHSLFSPFTTFLSLLFIIGSLVLAIFLIKRNCLVSYVIFWFLGNLVIESSIIPLDLVFEHRLYLPSMGFTIMALGLFFSLTKREWETWVTGVIILLLLLFSYWTYARASVWRGPLSLWTDATKKSPHKARPHNNLGYAYNNKGILDEAISEFKKSLTINPNSAVVHSNLGGSYNEKGMLDEAISEFKKALALNPNSAEAHTNLGIAYGRKGRLDEAISEHKRALAVNPNSAEAHANLGTAYGKKGMLDDAISEFKQSLIINPHSAKAYYNLGTAYDKKGLLEDAISEYKKALTINPYYAKAYHNLGLAFKARGKLSDAISAYRKVLSLKPDNYEVYNDLAWIYATSPKAHIRSGEEAVTLATKACELTGFKKAEALDTLAAAYAEQGRFDKAVEYQHKAIELAPPQIKKELQEHLQFYKQRRAYRDK